MTYHPPRFLQVAHWLQDHQVRMSARQMATIFNVPHKIMCDDFAMIRRRTDLFIFDEVMHKNGLVRARLMAVTYIHPYIVDGRRYPRKNTTTNVENSNKITWQDLLSRSFNTREGANKSLMGSVALTTNGHQNQRS